MVPVISFVGRSGCGKTTYLEKLIAEMKRRGHKLGIIKHDVHGFDMDRPGKDTWRHAQAGADVVCISSPAKVAIIAKVDEELALTELVGRIHGVEVIFTEGYKYEGWNRVEVFRREACGEPLFEPGEIVAMASDEAVHPGLPCFGLDDPAAMADFLEAKFLQSGVRRKAL